MGVEQEFNKKNSDTKNKKIFGNIPEKINDFNFIIDFNLRIELYK